MEAVTYLCGEVRVEPGNRRLSRAGSEIPLEPKAFAALLQLLARPGELVTRDELLDAVWGHRYVTPATLNRVVTLLRRAFGDDANAPRFIDTVHGAGYRYVGPLQRQESSAAELRARFAPPVSARLPARLEALVGRERELARLSELLAQHRGITLVGAGGMGKTQCALEFARESARLFPDGVWFFDLVPFENTLGWLKSMADALSVRADTESGLRAQVCAAFQGRKAMLVLDNCERIATAVGEVVLELLHSCEELRILATSQRSLSFRGEHLLSLPPLALPDQPWDAEPDSLARIAAAPAVKLLLLRTQALQSGFALSAENARSIVRICERLDGVPLALELAAVRLATLSPDEVLERLEQRFSFLSDSAAGRADRHQTLAALLEWSFGLLSAAERRLLEALGVFVQGWTAEAAEHVAGAIGMPAASVMPLLGALVSKSLVSVDPTLSPTRYRLLESVREFALGKLREGGAEALVRRAHLAYYCLLAERSRREILLPSVPQWNQRLKHEHGNIDAALEWSRSAAGRDDEAALRLVGALMLYAKCTGEGRRAIEWGQRALADSALVHSAAGARTLLTVGVNCFIVRHPLCGPTLAEAADIAARACDHWTVTYACGYAACELALRGDAEAAQVLAERTRALAGEDALLGGLASLAQGFVCIARGELKQALPILAAAIDQGADDHQSHFLEMYAGLCSYALGDLPAAASMWSQSLQRSIRLRHVRGAAGSIEGTAYLDIRRGEFATGAWGLGAAQAVRDATSMPLLEFWRPHHAAAVAAAREALGSAQFEQAWAQGAHVRTETAVNQAVSRLRQHATLTRH